MIMSDRWIIQHSDRIHPNRMIEPFVDHLVREENHQKIVSYGVSSYGYDVRLGHQFKIFTNTRNALIDPLNPDSNCYVDHEGEYCIIPPNSYVLGHTIETFTMPDDVLGILLGKSTYARLGAIINTTPVEPGFRGQVVIEISNATTLPLKVYANQGIAQMLFFKGNESCITTYADRDGKYQDQQGVTTAIV